jgi:hypothetical protein
LLLRPRPIRIDAALNLRQPLLMCVNHLHDSNHTAGNDRTDRHQQAAQSKDPIHHVIQSETLRQEYDDRFSGGADRDRTGGLLVANQALSQLSYSPTIVGGPG